VPYRAAEDRFALTLKAAYTMGHQELTRCGRLPAKQGHSKIEREFDFELPSLS
jgi:hypothetical protein